MIESPFRCLPYEGGYWQVQGREGAEVFLEYGGFLMRQRVVAMKKRSDATFPNKLIGRAHSSLFSFLRETFVSEIEERLSGTSY